MRSAAVIVGFAWVLSGCLPDELGLVGDGGDVPDGTMGHGDDAGAGVDAAKAEAAPGPMLPCTTPPGSCVQSIPQGWNVVAYEDPATIGCPVGFSTTDTELAPTAQPGACTCSCTLDTPPTCMGGKIGVGFGFTNCSQAATSFNVAMCSTIGPYNIPGVGGYFQASGLPPTGGGCSDHVSVDMTKVSAPPTRLCAPPQQCEEDTCLGKILPSGYKACITTSGDQTCPSAWPNKSNVATSYQPDCICSTCQVKATCTNATVTVYSDGSCNNAIATLAADGKCNGFSSGAVTIAAARYTATLSNPGCTPGSLTGPTFMSVGAATVCCR